MKIAVVSTDGATISQHFGRATLYVVYSVANGKVGGKETRSKITHHHSTKNDEHECGHDGRHGCDSGSQVKHASMMETIADCNVLMAGGMGWGAYESLKSYNIEPVVTDVTDIEEAVKLHLAGNLPNLMERLH